MHRSVLLQPMANMEKCCTGNLRGCVILSGKRIAGNVLLSGDTNHHGACVFIQLPGGHLDLYHGIFEEILVEIKSCSTCSVFEQLVMGVSQPHSKDIIVDILRIDHHLDTR